MGKKYSQFDGGFKTVVKFTEENVESKSYLIQL